MRENGNKSNLSQNVMERILDEDRWTLPVHEQKVKPNRYFKPLSSFILIIALLGVIVSFVFIQPTSGSSVPVVENESITSMVEPVEYAKTFPHLEFLTVSGSTIIGTGEPGIYVPNQQNQNEAQLFWIGATFVLAIIILFLSWLSRRTDNPTEA
jgi:hypothetical protein